METTVWYIGVLLGIMKIEMETTMWYIGVILGIMETQDKEGLVLNAQGKVLYDGSVRV